MHYLDYFKPFTTGTSYATLSEEFSASVTAYLRGEKSKHKAAKQKEPSSKSQPPAQPQAQPTIPEEDILGYLLLLMYLEIDVDNTFF